MSANSIRPTKAIEVPENHLRALIDAYQLEADVIAIGIRGFTKSIANAKDGENLIGVYDDALCVCTASTTKTFAGNTDPSRTIEGRAILEAPQLVWYVPGIHGKTKPAAERRLAFIQDSGVSIRRFDGKNQLGSLQVKQWIGCNIHDGAWTTTGSAACQTVVPERWREYVGEVIGPLGITFEEWDTVEKHVKDGGNVPATWARKRFPYLLTI
jgi:hypothetical protein